MSPRSATALPGQSPANQIHLVGRVSSEPVERELPSGDRVVAFRLVVPRDAGGADTIDIAAWTARLRRTAAALHPDQVITVDGALRRRFFRTSGVTASRYEVEAQGITRLRG